MSLPFVGLVTFAMVPRYDATEVPAPHAAILGIPTDEGTTQHPGARYGPRAIRDAGDAYLTIDIDAFDPSAAPGTGFAEPGGLTFTEVARLVRGLAKKVHLRGMDMVEVSPYLDGSRRTAVLAARTILETLSAVFDPSV